MTMIMTTMRIVPSVTTTTMMMIFAVDSFLEES